MSISECIVNIALTTSRQDTRERNSCTYSWNDIATLQHQSMNLTSSETLKQETLTVHDMADVLEESSVRQTRVPFFHGTQRTAL